MFTALLPIPYQMPLPVLIIHGTADQVVPIQYGRDAADPAKGFPNARIIEIKGANHGFSGGAWQQAKLLEAEGVEVNDGKVDLTRFQFLSGKLWMAGRSEKQ